jgi:hypothetical protein
MPIKLVALRHGGVHFLAQRMFRAEHHPPVSLCAAGTPAGSEPLELFGAKTSGISRFERLTALEPLDRS